jgi:hypothetical protein
MLVLANNARILYNFPQILIKFGRDVFTKLIGVLEVYENLRR